LARPLAAESAVEAAAVANKRRRDTGKRMLMEALRLREAGEDAGQLSHSADGCATPS